MSATVDKSSDRVRQMFGEISSRYDFMNHFLSGGIDYLWRWKTIRVCPPEGKLPILDVCTGTGDLAIAYWEHTKRTVPVYGTDFTPEMLRIAEEKRNRRQKSEPVDSPAPLIFSEADTQHLPFPDDKFQIVSVAFGLRNVQDTKAGLTEMIRVCAPGGRVAILEFSMPTNPLIRAVYGWYFRNVLPLLGQLFARNRQDAYNYLPNSVAEFPQGEAMAEILRGCGLQEVRVLPLTMGVASLYLGRKPLMGKSDLTTMGTDEKTISQGP